MDAKVLERTTQYFFFNLVVFVYSSISSKTICIFSIFNGYFEAVWLVPQSCLMEWVTYDHFWSALVLPLLCLVFLSMTNHIAIIRGTLTLHITSLFMITLISPFVLDPFLIPLLIQLLCPLCSMTVGNKLGSWVDRLWNYQQIICNRQMTWNKRYA